MKFALEYLPNAKGTANTVREWLVARGHTITEKEPDFAIIFGGDGFILEKSAKYIDVPMIRVNFGHRGFLANIKPDEEDIFRRLEDLFAGRFIIQHRDRIAAFTDGIDYKSKFVMRLGDGLNDVVVERVGYKTIAIEIRCGIMSRRYVGDGVIFATRTGSSGYNRSAGGPITEKEGNIVVTPICPVDQAQWEMISIDAPEIEVAVFDNAVVVIDGQHVCEITPGEKLYIKLYGHSKFVEFGDE